MGGLEHQKAGSQGERRSADHLPDRSRLGIVPGEFGAHAWLNARSKTVTVRSIGRDRSSRGTEGTRILEQEGTARSPVRSLR